MKSSFLNNSRSNIIWDLWFRVFMDIDFFFFSVSYFYSLCQLSKSRLSVALMSSSKTKRLIHVSGEYFFCIYFLVSLTFWLCCHYSYFFIQDAGSEYLFIDLGRFSVYPLSDVLSFANSDFVYFFPFKFYCDKSLLVVE